MSALSRFDGFLASGQQRDLTRALLAALFELRGLALVVGDPNGVMAARLVSLAAQHWPNPNVHVLRIDAAPTRIAMGAGEARVVEGGTEVALRSALRQDPDVIALSALEEPAAKLVLTAVQTGHAVVLGSSAPDVETVLTTLCGGEAWMLDHARASLELVIELKEENGRVSLHRVSRRHGAALAPLAWVNAARVELDHSVRPTPVDVPVRALPEHTPRTPAIVQPRRAWVPVVGEGASRHALGTTTALRPAGDGWPACRGCEAPLQLVVQLDLSALPGDFALPVRSGIAQLFVCPSGCETMSETDVGVRAELLADDALAPVTIVAPASHVVVAPGAIVAWRPVDEEPGCEDRLECDDDASNGPLRADKLGGWPAWAQGAEWPLDDDGAPMTLLFQIVEGETRVGGTPARWNFDDARLEPGTPARRVLDEGCPRHFPLLLTAEATALLFLSKRGRLAFRWQTG